MFRVYEQFGRNPNPPEAESTPNPEADITITVSIHGGQFYTNARDRFGSFICTTAQPTLDLSIASAMSEIRAYAERAVSPHPVDYTCSSCSDTGVLPTGGDALDFCTCDLGYETEREALKAIASISAERRDPYAR